jgi:hypothetical protein
MGLDTTHNCWHGPYSAFHVWRTAVARAAGYGEQWPDNMTIHGGENFEDVHMGKWVRSPDDPLMVLLLHQDCEGEILPEHAGPLADRLEGLLGVLPRDADHWCRQKTIQFIAGLRDAASRNEVVDFR